MWSSIQLVSVLGWLLVLVAYVATQFGYLSAKGLAFAYANIVGSGILAVVAALEDRHELYLADKGFACVGWERHWAYEQGSLVVATPKDNSKRAWSRSPLGGRQTPDHRGGHSSAQGHLRSGAPRAKTLGEAFDPPSCQGRSLHLRAEAQR